MISPSGACRATVWAIALTWLSGCGGGTYDELLNRKITEAKRAAPFAELYAAQTLPGTRVSIRVPQVCGKSYNEASGIDAKRLKPPFITLPGFALCYEAIETDPELGKVPFYCYLAVKTLKPGTLPQPIAVALKRAFPQAVVAWEVASVNSPTGAQVNWQKLRVAGEQEFDVEKQGAHEFKKLPGIFEIWLYEAPEYSVMVGWRIPESLEPRVHLLDKAPITAGSIAIDPAPADAPAPGAKPGA